MGFLGPGPIGFHVEHAQAFADALPSSAHRFVDIGSGGGIPGLPIALARPDMTGALLDASQKRTAFLVWAVNELDLTDRVEVITGRAEDVARAAEMRCGADVVVSRGFGPPSMTVECAAGLVRDGGLIVISEPPERRAWPADALGLLGLAEQVDWMSGGDSAYRIEHDAAGDTPADTPPHTPAADDTEADGADGDEATKVVVFKRTGELADRFPRSAKQLKRSPLFDL